jgi:hypothetical protein
MNHHRSSISMSLAAPAFALLLLGGTALAQGPAAAGEPPVTTPGAGQPARRPVNPERLKAFRDQLRKHVDERLTQARRITQRLEEALTRIDAGDDVRELKDLIDGIPTVGRRGGGTPGAPAATNANPNGHREREHGGPNARPERPAGGAGGGGGAGLFGMDAEPTRPLSPEELDDTVAQLREHNAEAADQLERLREEQPGVFKRVVEWLGSRTGAIREARERGDRPMVKARWDEVRAMLDLFRIARALEQGAIAGTAADPAAREELQEKMRDALGRQFDARMEVQALQIVALEKRTGEMRRNLESLREKRDEVIRDGAQRAASLGTPRRRGEPKPQGER